MESERKLSRQELRAAGRKNAKLERQALQVQPDRPLTAKTAVATIEQDNKQEGLIPVLSEIMLWNPYDYSPSTRFREIDDVAMEQSKIAVSETLSLMRRSRNPIFKDTYQFLINHADSEQMIIGPLPRLAAEHHPFFPKGEASMCAGALPEDGTLKWLLMYSADKILNASNHLTIALQLTHETEHIKRMQGQISESPDTSADGQSDYIQEFYSLPDIQLQEEAFADGKAAEAFIYQFGLGWRGFVPEPDVLQAATFITCGRDPESEDWKRYLLKTRLQYLRKKLD